MNNHIPKGWVRAALSEIADINPRHPKVLDDSIPVSFATMAAISEFSPEFVSLEERPLGEVCKGFTHFAEGDVLFAKITPCMENGKGAVATGLRNGLGCGTTELHIIRPLGGINPYYLFRFLAQTSTRRGAQENFTGTAGQLRVPSAFIKGLEVPLASLREQSRIVAKLEKLLGKVDACQKRLSKIPVLLKRFRQSVLVAACSGRLTADWRDQATVDQLELYEPSNPRAIIEVEEIIETPGYWRWLPLQAVCDPARPICYGVIKLGANSTVGVPCLRTSDVKPMRVDTSGVKRIAVEISERYRRTLLRGGEVLVNVRGTLGGVAAVTDELRGWNVSREIAVVPVRGILEKFVTFWIASTPSQNWLTVVAKGVAYTGINIEDLRLLPVAIPSISEQQEIVRRVEALFALADQLELRFAKAKASVDKLTQSILSKAFRGELVPQDPNDEPASVLLERIKTGRAKQEMETKGKSTRKRMSRAD